MKTINHIILLAHSHVYPERHPQTNSAAFAEAAVDLLKAGLIEVGKGDYVAYRTTPKGAAHLKQMGDLPLPEQAWIGHNGKVL